MRQALGELLAAPQFARSPKMVRLLRYLVEQKLAGRADGCKEIVIAAEVYGKAADYDPSVDSLVRVEMSRLRGKLRAHYEGAGAAAGVVFEIPSGSYEPHWRAAPQEGEVRRGGAWWVWVAGLAGAANDLRIARFRGREAAHTLFAAAASKLFMRAALLCLFSWLAMAQPGPNPCAVAVWTADWARAAEERVTLRMEGRVFLPDGRKPAAGVVRHASILTCISSTTRCWGSRCPRRRGAAGCLLRSCG